MASAKSNLPPGMQPTKEISKQYDPNEEVPQPETDRWGDMNTSERENRTGVFSATDIGQPDVDIPSVQKNRQEKRGRLGPLQQEGEGNRQHDELAALEEVQPDIDLDDPTKD